MPTITKEEFLVQVAKHEMTILKDDGFYRHVRFVRPNTNNAYFDLITWDGHLCYTGDMGTYVFARIKDMFAFFRYEDNQPYINPMYWAEKVLAEDTNFKMKKYSPEVFISTIRGLLDDIDADSKLRQAVNNEVIPAADDGEHEARKAIENFNFSNDEPFSDFWECDLTDYTYHYLWCCYAIVWGIEQYDKNIKEV